MKMTPTHISFFFIELGAVLIGLAMLTRLAKRLGFSAIPLYLIAGLAFGNGGLLPLEFSEDFVHVGAEIGVVLLLFMLGLEYTGKELGANLRHGFPAGVVDLLLNFPIGLIVGLVLGWNLVEALLLGGVTYISSSGVISKILVDLGWYDNQETPVVVTILVLEDLAMAVYLPIVAVLLLGQGLASAAGSVAVALFTVVAIFLAVPFLSKALERFTTHPSDEVILFSVFGLVLLVAGISQELQISAAIGAFLVGLALPKPIVERVHRMLDPLSELFAAIFFLFFGLEVNPESLLPVLLPAALLAVFTVLAKFSAAWWATRRDGVDRIGGLRAGALLMVHGEFSIVIAGLGITAGLTPELGALAAAYMLLLVVAGPVLARVIDRQGRAVPKPD